MNLNIPLQLPKCLPVIVILNRVCPAQNLYVTGVEIYQHGFDVVRCAVFDCTHRAGKCNKQKSYDYLADFYLPGAPSHIYCREI